jgi:dipeptidyl aminopeptidase/acylaminoacyl peptidase
MATATRTPGANGAIASLDLIVRTAHSEYYALTYWSDGLRVKGFLGRPTKGTGVPAIIFNRGGHGEFGELWGQQLIPFVEAGFVGVGSQYRGACGSEGFDEFGGADVDDVLNLIPLLKGLPYVDPERIGMMGGSRGGMMTYLALKAQSLSGTRDIKVAATVGGLADLIMWASEQPGVTSVYAELIGTTTKQNTAPFIERSATYWPRLIRAPLLIEHGEADATISVQQSRRLYRLLVARGAAVKLITYPGGDHSLAAYEAGLPEVLKWFQKYMARANEDFSWDTHRDAIYRAMVVLKNAH